MNLIPCPVVKNDKQHISYHESITEKGRVSNPLYYSVRGGFTTVEDIYLVHI